ncbi:MAG: hypothetical protein H7Y17_01800 [Chlorobia bacterium]|nr:hypothetical protein [Fimbriimonadaceae bacterium]
MILEGVEFQMLGYDARRMDPDWRNQRSGCGWDSFLIRTDIECPLSTDDAVWDFALDWHDPKVVKPDWTGPFQHLWENLADMEVALTRHKSLTSQPYWVIGVARARNESIENRGTSEGPYTHFTNDQVSPASPAENWTLLGYDVSDYSQLSGLMNCGYDESDRDRMEYFAPKLNPFHLFSVLSVAEECRGWMDKRVQEHAPFFVYALFKIREEA